MRGLAVMLCRTLCVAFVCAGLAQYASPQDSQPSLADAARQAREAKGPKAKTVITEDDLKVNKGPIPDVELVGFENSRQIIEAIHEFARKHNTSETEQTIRQWYDRQIESGHDLLTERDKITKANAEDPYTQPYQEVEAERLRERMALVEHSLSKDQSVFQKNRDQLVRLQHVLIAVEIDLQKSRMLYKWYDHDFFKSSGTQGAKAK